MSMTRKEAGLFGFTTYFGGKVCQKCGDSERYTVNGDCVTCRNNRDRVWRNKTYEDPMYKKVRYLRGVMTMMRRKIHFGEFDYHNTSLGYSCQDLKDHMESLWKPGMDWSNHGDWHFDHIRPVMSFVRAGIYDPAVIHALDNLQPLWSWENNAKRSTLDKMYFEV